MEKVSVLEVSSIRNQSVELFTGTKKYVATGDVDEQAIETFTEITYDNRPSRANIEVKLGQVLFARMKGTNKVIQIDESNQDYIYSTGFCVLEPSELVTTDYLRVFLKSDLFQIQKDKHSKGATQKAINNEGISKIKIPLPPLETQKKIVEALDKAQVLIDARKEQIRLMDELVKSQFIEMFGDQKSNPMNWDDGTIRDIVSEVKYGTSKPAIDGGNYKYLRMNNITYEGELDLTSLKYIDMDDDEYEKYVVRKGDVLFNRTNSKELVGKTCVFDYKEEMIIAGYIIRVRVNEKAVPEYLSAFLNSKYGKEKLFSMCKAIVGQANINAQELQDIKVLIPPNTLQAEFAKIKEKVNIEKSKLENNLNEIITIQQALMQQYFG